MGPLLDGESPPTPLEESPLSSGWSQICPASQTRNATTSTELLETELSALTLLEERDLAMVTLAPLVMKAGMKDAGQAWNQVGIVSFGSSAGCEVGYPAGFTRTEYYLDWITSETGM